ncbi:MAG: ATP-binding protein [[Clostridium] fimetarium]|nr:ATP-binding protein [Alistipes timonensis]MCM1405924.1 ATP-binding protein [[Clostridium] fimetarium]
MAGKIKLSFHHKVLFSLLSLCWALVAVFAIFQYQREKTFRAELLDMELQAHNGRVIDDMGKGEDITSIERRIRPPMEGLRLTMIDKSGKVLFDNNDKTPFPESNHNNRPEVMGARSYGMGHAVGRKSISDDTEYFYSATLAADGAVVRSAAPYDHTLRDFLRADRSFLWIMLLLTCAVSLAGYFIARRISTSISNLDNFAEKAGKGERIYEDWSFPHDELGRIAANIVRLYVQKDQMHHEALELERDKTRLKKQLTNNINHELKTPVASIKVCAELLRDHPELPEEKKQEFVNLIRADADRLATLLDDVASVTRMDDGAGVIEKERVNLAELIRGVVESERMKTDMAILCDVPPLEIQGNRRLLESVFRNLIDNAIAYSGGTEISITADNDGNFTVRDNGRGVDERHLRRLFERFYRVDEGRSRHKGGTGLGLSIVKNAVDIHGGDIRVTNDGGLRFDFRLG